jgi:hypothetical protein
VKPISIPDRWDDVTAIPGYAGAISRQPNWRNNAHYDFESFSDLNANRIWDPGEPFTDGNVNGVWDHEAYHPLNTGYIAAPNPANILAPAGDLGLDLTLHAGSPGDAPVPGQYLAIDFPALNRGTPIAGGPEYQENFANCAPSPVGPGDNCQTEPSAMGGPTNQLMRDLMGSVRVLGSDYGTGSWTTSPEMSPRIIRLPRMTSRTDLKRVNYASDQSARVLHGGNDRAAEVRGRLMGNRGGNHAATVWAMRVSSLRAPPATPTTRAT